MSAVPSSRRDSGERLLLRALVALGALGCVTAEHVDSIPAVTPDGGASEPPARVDAGGDASVVETKPIRVLFVGNSYTYVNDLPLVVRALGAATPGAPVEVDSVTEGSATLQSLWASGAAPSRIATGSFDRVVLQGNSLEAFGFGTYFYPYAKRFGDAVRDAGARPVWYATWARRAGDSMYAAGLTTPDAMTRSIDHAYRKAADVSGGDVARVGIAWQLALAEMPGVALHAGDNSHPSPAGTLLTACTIFHTLTGREPVLPDPVPLGIDRPTATRLCAFAPRVRCGPEGCGCENAAQVTTTYDALRALAPACDGTTERIGLACNKAIDAVCAATSCTPRGFGPRVGEGDADLTCVKGTDLHTTFAALRGLDPRCDGTTERYGPHCAAAIDKACAATGALSGFGPTANVGNAVTATCVPRANALRVRRPFFHLRAFEASCDGVTETWGPSCHRAIDRLCRAQGFAGGFGPVAMPGADPGAFLPISSDAGAEPAGDAAADIVCVTW